MVPLKRGRKRIITEKHIQFLKNWFQIDQNVGKPFKYAFNDLKKEFKDEITVSLHGCYKNFKKYSNMSFKKIQRVKIKSN